MALIEIEPRVGDEPTDGGLRGALLRMHDEVRDHIGLFLDHPSSATLAGLRDAVEDMFRREAALLHEHAAAADHRGRGMSGHDQIRALLDQISWSAADTARLRERTLELRRVVLHQLEAFTAGREPPMVLDGDPRA